tara:strand:+ start:385 stop:498 length:114 start_codon:yes stop_codon:yes gene_type:complete
MILYLKKISLEMKLLDKFTRGFSKEALLEELNVHETS